MDKVYEYENCTIYVSSVDTYDRENLKKATEEFLRKVIKERNKVGNINTTRDIRKE